MTELDKLIEEFKITLSKFEAIASRMEARMGAEPVDPLADLPPFPPVPEGYSRWVYRGKGWKSDTKVQFAAMGRYNWVTQPFGRTSGYNTSHYIEAVKDESVAPAGLLPFPPIPEGYSRWVYRGKGWSSDKPTKYAYRWSHDKQWNCAIGTAPVGYENSHYIEAVKDEQSVPEVAVPFPPIPEGYSRWVYRGKGWTSMDPVKYAYWMYPFKMWVTLNDSIPVGDKDTHYIEAVKDPA